mgnify:FL=1
MTPDFVLTLAERAVFTTILIAAPLLLIALAVGLLVSIFQATTQIQEQTLAFIPKIIAVFVSVIFFGPWMLSQLLNFTYDLVSNLQRFVS